MNEFEPRYHLSFDTLMLQPKIDGNKVFTRVIERERTLIVPKKPIHIITGSCTFYGSSYTTAMNTSKRLFGDNKQKAPFLLANSFGIPFIFIPTLSPYSDQNVWISYHAIDFFDADGLGTSVTLENGQKYKLDISVLTMNRQYTLAKLLERDFLKRQKNFHGSLQFPPKGSSKSYPSV
ncbi:competence protein ComK [Sporosarcina luteola]|uniref:competence protein ComK n=1 Tax=Sporosarcina luteola TaxID=582850 RepID=UPI00203AD51C|nr:competence protein ComK [Sporosarcina luteola]MCM3743918.1 competence protein ComK [Sporosarcina luteola]